MANRRNRLVMVGGLALVGAAVVTELRKPASERDWHGKVGGLIPYDFRPPTPARLRDAMWQPEVRALLVPQAFGVGWTVNFGAVATLLRNSRAPSAQ